MKMVHTMLIEEHFLKKSTYNTIIKTDLSFTLVHTNCGPPIKLFRLYIFSFLETSDTPSRNPIGEPLRVVVGDTRIGTR